MPIYEYVCKKCECAFEAFVHGSRKAECPDCGSKALEKKCPVFAAPPGRDDDPMPGPGACGTCGDPRGPGSCSF